MWRGVRRCPKLIDPGEVPLGEPSIRFDSHQPAAMRGQAGSPSRGGSAWIAVRQFVRKSSFLYTRGKDSQTQMNANQPKWVTLAGWGTSADFAPISLAGPVLICVHLCLSAFICVW